MKKYNFISLVMLLLVAVVSVFAKSEGKYAENKKADIEISASDNFDSADLALSFSKVIYEPMVFDFTMHSKKHAYEDSYTYQHVLKNKITESRIAHSYNLYINSRRSKPNGNFTERI